MNIDVTALQPMPELATTPAGLRPKQCKTATVWRCDNGAPKSCVHTNIVVYLGD